VKPFEDFHEKVFDKATFTSVLNYKSKKKSKEELKNKKTKKS